MKFKYNVGDKVKVRSDLTEGAEVISDMLPYNGTIQTVEEVTDGDYKLSNGFIYAEDKLEVSYDTCISNMIRHCEEVLIAKHREYATSDHFHNFNNAAVLQGITPEQALIGMMDKHVVSVHDLVNEHAEGRVVSLELWKEKIGDNINYLLILWSMVNLQGV